MKKLILILLFLTGFLQAQTLPNPTFGTVTTKTAPAVTSTGFIATVGSTGVLGKIDPVNLPFEQAKYTSVKTVGASGDYTTLEDLFLNEPSGKTLIKLLDAQYTCLNPKFVVKNGWIIQGQGYGKTNITFNFNTTIDPELSGLQIRTNCELVDFKVTSIIDTNLGGFSQYALHADYLGIYTAKITRCYFKKVSSPNVADANNGNGLSVGVGSWEGQNIEFRECILEGQGIAVDNKYTLNLHNTFITTLHSTPSRVSFYNCRLSGGFTTVLISDVYSRDSDPNASRIKDLFEFVGTEIKGGLWLRSKSVSGTIDKKNGLNFNFSGSSIDEFLNTSEIVDTSLSNYDFSSIPVTKDVEYYKNTGASTINAGDFVAYVYANRLPEYHLTSEKTINVPVSVEKLSSLNYKNFAGISLVSSASGNFLHFAKGAIAYTSLISTTLVIGDNVTFDASGNLIKSNDSGIGKIVRKTYDNRLGISLIPNGKTTNVIGTTTNRGVVEIEGNVSTVGSPTIRMRDYNGGAYAWQTTLGTGANMIPTTQRGRYSINDLDKGQERIGIDENGNTLISSRMLSVQNPSADAVTSTGLSIGTSSKPGFLKLANGYNSGNGFEISQATSGIVSFKFNSTDNAVLLDPTTSNKLQVNGGITSTTNTLTTTPTTSTGSYDVLTRNTSTGVVEKISSSILRPYKVYTALISQTGTSAPTATVLENSLGGTVTFTRTVAGNYLATLTGAFTISKTACFITATTGTFVHQAVRNSTNDVTIVTLNNSNIATDSLLNNTTFEIRVYL